MEKLLSSTAETEMSLDAFKLMAIVPSQQNTSHSREITQKLPAPEWSGKLHWRGPPDYTANFSQDCYSKVRVAD
jgi:hypothetical protein